MAPPNGGSTEYQNIVGGVSNIQQLLDEEFAKKVQAGDLNAIAQLINNQGVIAAGTVAGAALPLFQPSPVAQWVTQLGGISAQITSAAGNIIRGGIGGLVALGKVVLSAIAQVVIITFSILMAVFFIETEIQRIGAIINELLTLRDRVTALEEELLGLRQTVVEGFSAVNNNVVAVNANLEQVQGNLARGIRVATASTNDLIKNESLTVKTAVNSVKEDLSEQIESFQSEQQSEWANNRTWQFDNRAAAVATLTVAGVNAPEGLLDRTFKGTEAIKQSVASVQTAVNNMFEEMKKKFKSVGSMIDVGRIIDVITLIGVIHNASMLSSSLFATLFQVVDNSLNIALRALGVIDVEGEQVDSEKSFQGTFDNIGKQIFGVQTWEQLKARWAAANRIVATGSTLLWSVRDLMDNTQNLAEIAAENSAKVGNALRRAGQIFDIGAWFPENYSRRTVLHSKLTDLTQFLGNAQNLAQVFEDLTSTTIEIQENIEEIDKNNQEFQKALKEGEKKIREDNKPVKDEEDEAKRKPATIESIQASDLDKA